MRSLFLLVLFTTTSVAQDVDPDLEKQVFALIADYKANQEKIYESNFAFVGRTINAHANGKSLDAGDQWYLCVYESKKRRLDAGSQVVGNNIGRHMENWQQHLLYDGKTMFRPSIRRSITVRCRLAVDEDTLCMPTASPTILRRAAADTVLPAPDASLSRRCLR